MKLRLWVKCVIAIIVLFVILGTFTSDEYDKCLEVNDKSVCDKLLER